MNVEHLEFYDADGNLSRIVARRTLCDRCNGDGKVCHPAFSEQAITAEEWNHEWDDFDRGLYLSGAYDVECPKCHGRRWVLVPDEATAQPELLQEYREYQEEMADLAAQEASERRYGA